MIDRAVHNPAEGQGKLNTRVLAIVAGLLGGFVVLSELPYWRSASSLAPVLTAIGVALIVLAVAVGRPQQ